MKPILPTLPKLYFPMFQTISTPIFRQGDVSSFEFLFQFSKFIFESISVFDFSALI